MRGDVPDLLLLLEHWPVLTKGRRSEPSELGMGEDWYRMQGIEVCETDRGGRVTYHGPGQLVAYPIIDLKPYGEDVHAYVRRLERVMISSLAEHGVPAQIFDGLTGVWTAGQPPVPSGEPGPQGSPVGAASEPGGEGEAARKIGSIGIHVSRGITTHGLAINVNTDLQPFEWIVPCGIELVRMTSLSRERGGEQDLAAVADTVADRFAEVFGRVPEQISPEQLAGRAELPLGAS
jgi:lipoyl(octanoyl) transferase